MSFVKKALKKAWTFVKKHWKTIVLVAAIAFTAGVATIGFGAFAGAQGVGGFLSAVGQTMWAGIAGTAGSMGIGSGAAVPAGSALAAQGVTHVGLGAAWGAGGGYGLGVAGKTAAAQALAGSASPAYSVAYEQAIAKGATEAAAKEAGTFAAKEAGTLVAEDLVVKTGLTLDKAMKYAAVIGPIVGPMLMAAGQEEELNQYNTDAAFGGVQFTGPRAEGSPGPGRNWLEEGFDVASPDFVASGGGTSAADALFQNQMQRPNTKAFNPLMGRGATGRGLDGRLLSERNSSLMGA